MAFKGMRFAHGEIHNNSAGFVMKIVMLAIGVIPLLYGALYLLAFMDPYEQLDTVPVAVVNEDEGAVVNGEFRTVGNEVVDRLAGNHEGLGWQFVDAAEARAGLEAGRYYMTCTIPADFTRDIASADTDSPEHAQLKVEYNETQNMLASQIGGTVWKEVRTEVSDAVAKEYWNAVFDKVNSGADDLQQAADGAAELEDGLKAARSGSRAIADNLVTLNKGAGALDEGLRQLVAGTLSLQEGAQALANGSVVLKDGSSQLAQGTGELQSGARDLKSGSGALAQGAGDLASGTASLKDGASEVANGADSLKSGAADAYAGSQSLKEGTSQLASGAATLDSGAKGLSDGAARLKKEGTSALSAGAGQLEEQTRGLPDQETVEKAQAGSQQVSGGIAKLQEAGGQLASGANALQDGAGQLQDGVGALIAGTAKVEGALDEANGYLDTAKQDAIAAKQDIGAAAAALQGMSTDGLSVEQKQALATALQSLQGASQSIGDQESGALLATGTAQAYVQGAKGGLTGSGDAANPGVDEGLAQVKAGLDSLESGAGDLVAGIGSASDTSQQTLNGGLNALAAGYGNLSSQIMPLVEKSPELRAAIEEISGGASKVDANMDTLVSGAAQVGQGASKLASGASDVDDGAGKLQDGIGLVSGGAGQLADGARTLSAGAGQVNSGASELAGGATRLDNGVSALASGADKLADGAARLDGGIAQAVLGTSQLAGGAVQLHDGAQSAQSGSQRIADGSKQLADGSAELATGLGDAVQGSSTLADGLAEGVAGMRVPGAEMKATVMNDPVQLDNEYYTTVKNYGTGFAPYFIALGLWVGALMTSFVFKPLNKRLILSGGNPAMVAFANYMPYALMSTVQALIMLVVLQFGLQLQIDNVGLYYAFGILTGLVFAAIMQVLTAAFGFPGKFIAIILLMLQLTSSAGTFPIEQTPAFFQTINPFLPMTYVVRGMRQVMTGLDMVTAAQCAGVLAAFGLACFLGTMVVARAKRMVTMSDLHPILKLG